MQVKNQYLEILEQNNVDTTKKVIFPLYRKSTIHNSIVKFTNTNTGSIVKESQLRTSKDYGDMNGSLGALGFSSSNWCDYNDNYCWTELTHEELLEFDENYRKKQEKKISTREKLKAISLLMPSFMHDNINLEQEVIDALIDISGIGTANNEQ